MRCYPETLLQRSMEAAVRIQQAYGAEHRLPWGVSECAFAVQDESGVYGYRAFGVPALAVQQEEERMVVAPYATMLALEFDPESVFKNLRWMNKRGWLARYGYYEAIDFTSDSRRSRRNRFTAVRQWMVHHQGMSLLAMANFLHEGVVRNGFMPTPGFRRPNCSCRNVPCGCAATVQPGGAPSINLAGRTARSRPRQQRKASASCRARFTRSVAAIVRGVRIGTTQTRVLAWSFAMGNSW